MPAATQPAYQQIYTAFSYLSNLALDKRRYSCFMQKRNPATDFITETRRKGIIKISLSKIRISF